MNEVQKKIIEKYKKNGIPTPISLTESTTVVNPSKNMNLMQKMDMLRKGAFKGDMNKLVSSNSSKSPQEFNPIPEKRNTGPKTSTPVPVETFAAKSSPELEAIESLFNGGGGRASISSDDQISYNTIDSNEIAPLISDTSFKSTPSIERQMIQKKDGYLKHAIVNKQIHEEEDESDISSFNINNLKKMMQEVAMDTMNKVLDEYTEKKKNKHFYEVVTVDKKDGQTVIKTEAGNHFKLVPVTVTKKS